MAYKNSCNVIKWIIWDIFMFSQHLIWPIGVRMMITMILEPEQLQSCHSIPGVLNGNAFVNAILILFPSEAIVLHIIARLQKKDAPKTINALVD